MIGARQASRRRAQRLARAASILALVGAATPSAAQVEVDILARFEAATVQSRTALARKSKPVDARPAREGEVIVTVILGEGKETQSPPARRGDMVVRNRCPETGNEEILVVASKFAQRYEGPLAPAQKGDWASYRPRGVIMRYFIVSDADGALAFTAPWGERMVARPGDAIVQDPADPRDTYRIAKAAFACTYEVLP